MNRRFTHRIPVCNWMETKTGHLAIIVILLASCSSLVLGQDPGACSDLGRTGLTLQDALKLGMKNNYLLRNYRLDQMIAQSARRIAKDPFTFQLNIGSEVSGIMLKETTDGEPSVNRYSTLGIEATISRDLETGGSFSIGASGYSTAITEDTPPGTDKYTSVFDIELTQHLMKGMGISIATADLVGAGYDERIAMMSLKRYAQSLLYEIVAAYYRVLKSTELVKVAEFGLQQAKEHLKATQMKYNEGLVAHIDVLQAENQLYTKENHLVNLRQSLRGDLRQLLLKLELDVNQEIKLTQKVDYEPIEVKLDEILSQTLANRLELKMLYLQRFAAQLDMRYYSNARLPELDLVIKGAYTNNQEAIEEAIKIDYPEWSATVGFEYTFGYNYYHEQYYQARLRLKKLENEIEHYKLELTQEAISIAEKLERLEANISILDKAMQQAKYGLELANKSYQEGLIRNIDLLKAQDDYLQARSNYISAVMDYEVAKAQLDYVMGTESQLVDIDNTRQ